MHLFLASFRVVTVTSFHTNLYLQWCQKLLPRLTLHRTAAPAAVQQPMLHVSSSAAASSPSILESLSTSAPPLPTATMAPSVTPSASASRASDPPTLLSSSVPGLKTPGPGGSQPPDQYRGPRMMTPPSTPRESMAELDKSQPLPPGWTEHVSKTTGESTVLFQCCCLQGHASMLSPCLHFSTIL